MKKKKMLWNLSAAKQTEYVKTLKMEESAEKMYKYAMPLQYLMLKEAPIVILPLFSRIFL